MTNPELKTVPVTDLAEALRPFANAVFNDNGDVTYNFTAYSTDDLFRAYRLMKRYDALAASPPPPVAGDEGAIKRHADWPIDPDTGLRMLLDDAAPPPPPADLKAEAKQLQRDYLERWGFFFGVELTEAIAAFGERIRAAAHAAGKAEGEAEITRIRAAHALERAGSGPSTGGIEKRTQPWLRPRLTSTTRFPRLCRNCTTRCTHT